tara:strand:- start:3330 stop:3440 length:111 start_codon:yes stop_codon:yes gene_type:complete
MIENKGFLNKLYLCLRKENVIVNVIAKETVWEVVLV